MNDSPARALQNSEETLDRRLVVVGSATGAVLATLGTLENISLGIAPVASIVMGIGAVLCVGLVIAERRGVATLTLARTFITILLTALTAAWFSAGGIHSSVATFVPIVASIGVLVLPLKRTLLFLGALLGLVASLVTLEALNPGWVTPPATGTAGQLDEAFVAMVAVLAVGLATRAMRRAYVAANAEIAAQKTLVEETGQRLMVALAEAEQSNNAKSLFLANMSHELRTPLTGVAGRTELLTHCALPSEAREHVTALERSSKHLARLVDDLLDLGRIERDEFVARDEKVVLHHVVSDAIHDAAVEGGPKLVLQDIPPAATQIRVDSGRLRQVLTNLMANAVRHAEATQVDIHVSLTETQLRVRVEDDGRGIPEARIPRLSTPFERDPGSSAQGGLGLGLFVVQRIVTALGGAFEIDSEVGGGTRCTLTLPCGIDSTAQHDPSADAAPSAPPLPDGLRVLSAEDDPVLRSVLAAMFDALNVEAVVVEDGPRAIAKAREENFDVVFLDVNMPGESGPDVARAIAADARLRGVPRPRLIALTASAYAKDMEICRAAGMDAFLSKPVTLEDLRGALNAAERATLPA